ncbi:hypothetical protein QVD17_30077 [Tagetes erecta]|uniref:Uncharacterized protein n=1 Tax=Tagetes erecta TaxID=13708 RepID=A0AAD8NN49_TARER|nr:hypothetical protein QVD17_30077 [Tagetes erecta]
MKISSKSILNPGQTRVRTPVNSLSTSLSRRLRTNGSIKGGASPAMFPATAKKRGSFDNPEPSSPKVTCIGQVRVRSKKKQAKKLRTLSKRRSSGEVSLMNLDHGFPSKRHKHNKSSNLGSNGTQNQESKKWTICESLKAFGSEFSCLFHCKTERGDVGGEKDIELVLNYEEEEEEDEEESVPKSRRHVFEDLEIVNDIIEGHKDEARVSVCVPPKNALLLMRCRSDPIKAEALSKGSWEPNVVKTDEEDDEIVEDLEKFGEVEQKQVLILDQDHEVVQFEANQDQENVQQDEANQNEENVQQDEANQDQEHNGVQVQQNEANQDQEHNIVQQDEANQDQEHNNVQQNEANQDQEHNGVQVQVQQNEANQDQEHNIMQQDEANQDQEHNNVQQNEANQDQEHNGVQVQVQQNEANQDQEHNIVQQDEANQNQEHDNVQQDEANKHQEHNIVQQDEVGQDQEHDNVQQYEVGQGQEHEHEHDNVQQNEANQDQEHDNVQEYEVGQDQEHNQTEESFYLDSLFEEIVNQDYDIQQQEEAHNGIIQLAEIFKTHEQQMVLETKSEKLLPECLLMMMYEPKLSMEVSKETWVCREDFNQRQSSSKKPPPAPVKHDGGDDVDEVLRVADGGLPTVLRQPERSSCSLPAAAVLEQKVVNRVGYQPFVLTRCKSEPMKMAAAKLQPESCVLENRKLERLSRVAMSVGAAGLGF